MVTKIRDLPKQYQPVHRAASLGVKSLSTTELVAMLAGNSTLERGTQILAAAGGLGNLVHLSVEELAQIDGVGQANAVKLQAALELGGRAMRDSAYRDKAQVRSPADAANYLLPKYSRSEEENFVVLLLDTKNRIIGEVCLYTGSVNSSLIRVGEIFREPVRRQSPGIIIAHNHPSGDPTPSPEDVSTTRMIVDAGKLLDIDVLDHLVLGHNRWVSMKERGLGFS